MLTIRSSADMARAMEGPLDPDLRRLLETRRDQLTGGTGAELTSFAHFVVVQRGDQLSTIETETGFRLAGDESAIEWVERHAGGWLEAPVVTDDEGFAVVVIARDCICTDPDLLLALLARA